MILILSHPFCAPLARPVASTAEAKNFRIKTAPRWLTNSERAWGAAIRLYIGVEGEASPRTWDHDATSQKLNLAENPWTPAQPSFGGPYRILESGPALPVSVQKVR